jgi:signal transduction histidine kinase
LMLSVLAIVLAVGCWPLAQRMTRRLRTLEEGVGAWGAGELSTRVDVQGQDEIASVARRFNEAAAQIEAVFAAQQRMLASASHELRTPLTRLRVALELLDGEAVGRAAILRDATRDIEELDATVGDLLQVGRLQAMGAGQAHQEIDLLALLAEEASRLDVEVHGVSLPISGDPRLLRRMVRNLLQNAQRHGAPPVEAWTDGLDLVVADRGPGLPEGERERVFEPFHRPQGHDEGEHGGVGLGLFLVREIARHHGAEVAYVPREGGGSCFVVSFGGSPSA